MQLIITEDEKQQRRMIIYSTELSGGVFLPETGGLQECHLKQIQKTRKTVNEQYARHIISCIIYHTFVVLLLDVVGSMTTRLGGGRDR